MLDTQRLVIFEAVAKAGSFAGAARELGYTQPGISQQMRTLERELRSTLFKREGRGLRLTAEGQELSERASVILGEIKSAEEHIAALARLREGHVKICAFPSGNAMLIPTAIARFRAESLGLELELFEAEPPESLPGLSTGDYDLVVSFHYEGQAPPEVEASETIVLLEEPVVLLLREDHPVARRRQVDLIELADERWIAGCVRCRQQFVSSCEDAGFSPRIDITTDDNLAIQSHVVAGVGIAMIPEMMQSFVRHPRLRIRPVLPERKRVVTVTVLESNRRSPAIEHALAALQFAAGKISKSSPASLG